MSEKWIPWKSRLISIMGGEDNLTRPPSMLSVFLFIFRISLYILRTILVSLFSVPVPLLPLRFHGRDCSLALILDRKRK
jgi:hypothetical protein